MENQFDNTLVSEMQGASKRPKFLNVLCILSFICVGVVVLSTLYQTLTNTPEKQMETVEKVRQFSESQAQALEEMFEEQNNSTMAKVQPYITIIFQIISLLGVIQMFNLKRIGFYIYLAGELLPYIFFATMSEKSLIAMGGPGGKSGAILFITIMAVFDVAFIVMYALNLKYLKK
jgi:hypothetical protein